MISRRQLLRATPLVASAIALGAASRAAETAVEPELNDDGLHVQPFFVDTFLDMREDLAEAAGEGKRCAVLWEQKGCPYCREMHVVNFGRPEIRDYVERNFMVVQLNLWGSREVTDFDGQVLEERFMARKWAVNFTPTTMFFPETVADDSEENARMVEVARMPGYFKPFHFLSMYEFVVDKAYEEQTFQRYLQDRFAALEAAGKKPEVR